MSWTDYFNLGFGGLADGSTYMKNNYADVASTLGYKTSQPMYTITKVVPRVSYHPASYSKRWKKL